MAYAVPWWIGIPVSLGLTIVSDFASSVLPVVWQRLFFYIGVVLFLGTLTVGAWHLRLHPWMKENVWWRFKTSQPQVPIQGPVTETRGVRSASIFPAPGSALTKKGYSTTITLKVPYLSLGERECLINDGTKILTAAMTDKQNAQAASNGFDVFVRVVGRYDVGLAIDHTLMLVDSMISHLTNGLASSSCQRFLEEILRQLVQAMISLRGSLERMQRCWSLLDRDSVQDDTMQSALMSFRHKIHFSFQTIFEHIEAVNELIEGLRRLSGDR